MSVLDFLFEGSPPQSIETAATETRTLPAWYQEYLRGIMGKATAVAGEEYQPYDQPRIAPLTEDQLRAQQLARDTLGIGGNTASTAVDVANRAVAPFDPAQVEQYMNPYTDNVVNRIGVLAQRNLSENLLPAVNTTFTGAGQFGSSRHGDFTARAVRDANESALNAQAQALQSGYQGALGQYEAARGREIDAASRLGTLASRQQQLAGADVAQLEAVGRQNRDVDQANLNLAYQDFLEQRDYPREQVGFLSNVIRGVDPGGTTTRVGDQVPQIFQPSPIGQIAAGAGAIGALSDLFAAKGGHVKAGGKGVTVRRPGGGVERYAYGGLAGASSRRRKRRANRSGGLAYVA